MRTERIWSQEWSDLLQPGAANDFFEEMPAFAPSAKGAFDAGTALWMAEFCRLVYRQGIDEIGSKADPITRRQILEKVGWREVAFFNPAGDAKRRAGRRFHPAVPAEDTQGFVIEQI